MSGRYDQSDLLTYGAEDDEEMDMILDALDRASKENDGAGAPGTASGPGQTP